MPVLQRSLQAAAVIAAMALGQVVSTALDPDEQDARPFVRSGSIGSPVHLEYADVEVLGVEAAQFVSNVGTIVKASGRYLLVELSSTAKDERATLSTLELEDGSGNRYADSSKAGCGSGLTSDPGITTFGWLCFDVPPELLTSLRLVAGRGNPIFDGTRSDDVADIDLEIAANDAASFAATTAAYRSPSFGLQREELEAVDFEETGE